MEIYSYYRLNTRYFHKKGSAPVNYQSFSASDKKDSLGEIYNLCKSMKDFTQKAHVLTLD